ncbi:DNRLRE domain-containing protein [Nonomuraea sp. NPDC050663]|uniref:DNRLRE domain-containing protein n=1 Tax=Nonomuraea sp. NPDC050663 TaxID=3364370 RepID=UPI0037A8324B
MPLAAGTAGVGNAAAAVTPSAGPFGALTREAASALAAEQGDAVPVSGLTTETNSTVANPDGTFTDTITSGPARIQRDGQWVDIDPTLTPQDGLLKPKAAKADVEVSAGGSGPAVTMRDEEGRTFSLSWPTALPVPSVEGNVATFADAAGPAADLVVTVLPTGFRHDVVVRERPAGELHLRMPVQTDGLKLAETATGGLELTSTSGQDAGEVVAAAPAPQMWDSSTPHQAEATEPVGDEQVPVEADVRTVDGRTELTLTPDQAFLSDPDTTYPVTIDPTTSLTISTDTWVGNGTGAHAGSTQLKVKANPDASSPRARAYIKFNTSNIARTSVSAATLKLYSETASSSGYMAVTARRTTEAWDSSTTTWSNLPSQTDTGAAVGTGNATGWNSFDVVDIVKAWAGGTANYGFSLKDQFETQYTNNREYTSANATSNRPTLSVTYSITNLSGLVNNGSYKIVNKSSGKALKVNGGSMDNGAPIDQLTDTSMPYPYMVWKLVSQGDGTYKLFNRKSGKAMHVSGASTADGAVISQWADGAYEHMRFYPQNVGSGYGFLRAKHSGKVVELPNSSTSDHADVLQATADGGANQLWKLVPATTPSVANFDISPKWDLPGVFTTGSPNPTLRATVSDGSGGTLSTYFQVEHDPADTAHGTGLIWQGYGTKAASGAKASASLPTDLLKDGWKIRWRVRSYSASATSDYSDWQSATVLIPDKPTALSTEPDVADGGEMASTAPKLIADIRDAQETGSMAAQFEWWNGSERIKVEETKLATQGLHTVTIPENSLPEGSTITWRVRGKDTGGTYGPFSAWRSFTVPGAAPAVRPQITSSDFPAGEPGVKIGVPGMFTISAADQPFVAYLWDVDNPEPQTEARASAPGEPVTISYVAADNNLRTLYVVGMDAAGQRSPVAAYSFQASEALEKHTLGLGFEELDGTTTLDNSNNGNDATLHGGTEWSWEGKNGSGGLLLNGTDAYAQTARPAVRTDASYSVSAWVRLSSTAAEAAAVSQDGASHSGFVLGYDASVGGWLFAPAGLAGPRLTATAPVDPAALVHLAGVYDAATQTARLYVNGTLAKEAPVITASTANGPLAVGRAQTGGLNTAFWPGVIDELITYQRVQTSEEIAADAQ